MSGRGTSGWVGLASFILVYDTWALANRRESMTAAFTRALHHPLHRWPVTVIWLVTTLHLFGGLPDHLDPFKAYARVLAIGIHKSSYLSRVIT